MTAHHQPSLKPYGWNEIRAPKDLGGLSVRRQPAYQSATPKCHTPSPSWPRVLRRSAHRISGSHVNQHQAQSLEFKARERGHASAEHQYPSACRRVLNRLITCAAPNWAFNWTSTCCARCRQLTGALGYANKSPSVSTTNRRSTNEVCIFNACLYSICNGRIC